MDNAFFAFIASCVTAMAVENAVFAWGLGLGREAVFAGNRRQALMLGGLFTWMASLTALIIEGCRLLLEFDTGLLFPRLLAGAAAAGLITAAALWLNHRVYKKEGSPPNTRAVKISVSVAAGALFTGQMFGLLWLSANLSAIVWPVALLAAVLLALLGTYRLAHRLPAKEAAETAKGLLPAATLNTALFAALLHTAGQDFSFGQAVGYALGTGLGYTAALLIILYARKRLAISPIPRSFRGLPILLVYVGLISLALYGLRYIAYT